MIAKDPCTYATGPAKIKLTWIKRYFFPGRLIHNNSGG
jgi:hypothetical protein